MTASNVMPGLTLWQLNPTSYSPYVLTEANRTHNRPLAKCLYNLYAFYKNIHNTKFIKSSSFFMLCSTELTVRPLLF